MSQSIIELTILSPSPENYILYHHRINQKDYFSLKSKINTGTHFTFKPLEEISIDNVVFETAEELINTFNEIFNIAEYVPENISNKQNSLAPDSSNKKFPTVTAVNAGLDATNKLITGIDEPKNVIVCDGDSRTAGFTGTTTWKYSDNLNLGPGFVVHNVAIGGATLTNNKVDNVKWIVEDAFTSVSTKRSKFGANNIVVIWAGYNDMSVKDKGVNDTFESLKSYCLARKKEGWKVIVVTEPNHNNSTGEARRLEFNQLIRTQVYNFADGIADIGFNEFIGLPGTYTNTTFFFDGVHMTQAGYTQVLAVIQAAITKLLTTNKDTVSSQQVIVGDLASDAVSETSVLKLVKPIAQGKSLPQVAEIKIGRHVTDGAFAPKTKVSLWLKRQSTGDETAEVNVFEAREDGTVTLPNTTNAIIDAEITGKISTTKEWVNSKIQAQLIDSTLINAVTTSSAIPSTGNIHAFGLGPGTYTNWGGLIVPANNVATLSRISGVYAMNLTPIDLSVKLNVSALSNNINSTSTTEALNLAGAKSLNDKIAQGIAIWTPKDYLLGDEVNHLGIDWISNAAIVAGDVPGTSSKWMERLSNYGNEIKILNANKATLITGKNLFNKATVSEGMSISSGNVTSANVDRCHSAYIKVNELTAYYALPGFVTVNFYDKNFIWLGTGPIFNVAFTTLANTRYLIITIDTTTKNTLQLELGTTSTTYEVYKEYVDPAKINSYTKTESDSLLALKAEKVQLSNSTYVNNSFSEVFIDKGVNTYDIYVSRLFKNVDGICGFELKRSDTNVTINYEQYTSIAVAPSLYYNASNGNKVYLVIDWSKVNLTYSGFSGTNATAQLSQNSYIFYKNTQIASYKNSLDIAAISGSGTSSKLLGKKIAFIGDSITAGDAGVAYGGWPKLIGDKNAMIYSNYGLGGTCLAKVAGRTSSIIERLDSYSSDFDYVCLQGGFNDTAILPTGLGTITGGYNSTLDLYTFCGAAEYMCKIALSKYAGKKVCFLITYNIGEPWGAWADKLEEICKKWGMPYFDLRKYAGFNLVNSQIGLVYGVSTGVGTYDGWHCNTLAYDLLAPKIDYFLNSL